MIRMRRRLACCTKNSKISIDLDEQERVMTYNGLESCMEGNHNYETESKASIRDESVSNSLDEDNSSCSSSKDVFGSFSSKWIAVKRDPDELYEWEMIQSPQHFHVKEKPSYVMMQFSDIDTMKEKFAKLLLGEDIKGGCNGVSTALALSNAITNLAASVFGELWKLEPLPEEKKRKWRQELEWFLSPTNYMVELVPAKQHCANGRTLEIMTPKARADIHMNLPALQKLDSMLIETLDSMVSSEFWYGEGGSRAEGRGTSKRWWLPSPQVPESGLSDKQRKKLICQGNVVHQVFKAASSINNSVLLEMPVPAVISDALPRPRKPNLGTELFKVLTSESSSNEEMLNRLNLKTEHGALDIINKLEAAIFVWKEKETKEQSSGKSPVRTSWSFIKDPMSAESLLYQAEALIHHIKMTYPNLPHSFLDVTKIQYGKREVKSSGKSPVRTSWSFIKDPMSAESLLYQAEALIHHIKMTYPNLPHSFLDVTKIQYGKDIGHAILEAYSRVLANLAFRILCKIGDILQEDERNNPDTPVKVCCFPGIYLGEAPIADSRAKHSLASAMDSVDGQLLATPHQSLVCCIGREACSRMSIQNSP